MANSNGNGKSLESWIWDAACSMARATNTSMATPDIGDLKKGDLQGIRVYKYKIGTDLVLLACEIDGSTLYLYAFGSHQYFYRELSKYLHH